MGADSILYRRNFIALCDFHISVIKVKSNSVCKFHPIQNRIMDAKKDHAPQAAWPEKTASDGLGPEASVARRLRGPLNSLLLPGGFNRAILE
ncbi:hypothetical protein ACFSUK_34565 [Sphingobium scionense]